MKALLTAIKRDSTHTYSRHSHRPSAGAWRSRPLTETCARVIITRGRHDPDFDKNGADVIADSLLGTALIQHLFVYRYHTQVWYNRDKMTHTTRKKTKLLARVRRIRGQVEALERALEAEDGCAVVLQQISAVRGAMNALMTEVIEEQVRTHIASPSIAKQSERTRGANELIDVVRAYLK